jgi:hypothetical protein
VRHGERDANPAHVDDTLLRLRQLRDTMVGRAQLAQSFQAADGMSRRVQPPGISAGFPREAHMPGALVEYARFVEVRERRLRIIAELEGPVEVLSTAAATTAVDQCREPVETVTSAEERAIRGPIDVR